MTNDTKLIADLEMIESYSRRLSDEIAAINKCPVCR